MQKDMSALIKNASRFSDKGSQVQPAQLNAFGIDLGSRYGKCGEIIALLQFAQAAAIASAAHYVKSAYFDSKAGICSFDLSDAVVPGNEIERELFAIAKRTVGHFFWFDDEHFNDGEGNADE